jgi:hypothetical protein
MHEAGMTLAALHPQIQMLGVQDSMVVHHIGELLRMMAAQAGCIADVGTKQWTGLFASDHDIEVPGPVDVGLQLSPPPWF